MTMWGCLKKRHKIGEDDEFLEKACDTGYFRQIPIYLKYRRRTLLNSPDRKIHEYSAPRLDGLFFIKTEKMKLFEEGRERAAWVT